MKLLDLPPLETSSTVLFVLFGWCDCLVVVREVGPSWIPGDILWWLCPSGRVGMEVDLDVGVSFCSFIMRMV